MISPTDSQLVTASQWGDREAYGLLVERYSRHITALCMGMVGNVHDAEDLAQETFLKGFVRIGRIHHANCFPAWIKRIARNLCLDFFRRRGRGEILVAEVPERPGRANRIDTDRIDVRRAVEQLPEPLRLPVVFYYFEGRSVHWIARDLGIRASTVRGRLLRARDALHRHMVGSSRRRRAVRNGTSPVQIGESAEASVNVTTEGARA